MNEYTLNSKDAIKESKSNGWLMKWKIGDTWVKSPGFLYHYIWDSYSEAIASSVAKDIGINRHLEYRLCILNIDGNTRIIGCESKDYKMGKTELTLSKLIELGYIDNVRRTGRQGYEYTIKRIRDKFGLDIRSYLEDILMLDSLIINTDRNLWNISILVDREMNWHECPIYDSGNSLGLAGYNTGEFYEECMYSSGINAEPFSIYFEKQVKYIRNSRSYGGGLSNTNNTIKFIRDNLSENSNIYGVENALDNGQLEYIESYNKTV